MKEFKIGDMCCLPKLKALIVRGAMKNKPKVYISYAKLDTSKTVAVKVTKHLQIEGYDVFLDVERLAPGMVWFDFVVENIKSSDVLISLLENNMLNSVWAKREVDIARGADVSILPLAVDDRLDYVVMQELGLDGHQYLPYQDNETGYKQFLSIIDKLALQTQQHRSQRRVPLFNPLFGEPSNSRQFECDIFVIMPFAEEFKPVYESVIKSLEKDPNLNLKKGIKRGDDFFSHHNIMDEIWSALNACKIVIADCTGRNANVFYELGIAHTLGKPYVLITQNVKDAPFDIQGRRLIEYKDSIAGTDKLKVDLKKAILALMSELDGAGA